MTAKSSSSGQMHVQNEKMINTIFIDNTLNMFVHKINIVRKIPLNNLGFKKKKKENPV